MRIRRIGREGALSALAQSRPGRRRGGGEDVELAAARAEIARLEETVKEQAIELVALRGTALGLVGPVPARVDVDVKRALLGVLERAVGERPRCGARAREASVLLPVRWEQCGPSIEDAVGCRAAHRVLAEAKLERVPAGTQAGADRPSGSAQVDVERERRRREAGRRADAAFVSANRNHAAGGKM